MKEQKVFYYGGDLEHKYGEFWEFDIDEPNRFSEVIFLGKFIDSKGEKWDIGFEDGNRKTGILVYSNEAPCYFSPSFVDLAEANIQLSSRFNYCYHEAYQEMINRAEAKGLIK